MRRPSLPRAIPATLRTLAIGAGLVALIEAAVPAGAFVFPGVDAGYFGLAADLNGDGNEELFLSSIDDNNVHSVSPPTPLYVFAVEGNRLIDRSAQFLGEPPKNWMIRTVVSGDFNGDGQTDLFLCGAGREVDQSLLTTPRTPGVGGERDRVFFGRDGALIEASDSLPNAIDFGHGCSGGDLDHSGRDSIVVNNINGAYAPYKASYVLKWSGSQWVVSEPFPAFTGTRTGKAWGFYTATGDFDKNGYADVVGDQEVLWGGPSGPVVRPLTQPAQFPIAKFDMQGRAVADFNGDGYPDLVKIMSTLHPALLGARFVMYAGDKAGTFAEKVDAFPAVETYGLREFGIDVSVVDLNFDGFPDLATFGSAYDSGFTFDTSPTAVWLNDGTGRFRLAHFTEPTMADSVCAGRGSFRNVYFLKTADPKALNMVASGCYPGSLKQAYLARAVTPAKPLILDVK